MTPPETASATVNAPRGHRRVVAGLRKPANWLQLVQFGTVGVSGFVVNLIVYRLLIFSAGIHYLPAAVGAFCVAVTNNFLLNRAWTFRHRRDASHAAFQAARFLTVAVTALVPNLVLLRLFVETVGLSRTVSQVVAVCLVMPITFLGNKLWSFK